MLIKHDWKDICRALCVKKWFCQVVNKNYHKRAISQGKKHLSRSEQHNAKCLWKNQCDSSTVTMAVVGSDCNMSRLNICMWWCSNLQEAEPRATFWRHTWTSCSILKVFSHIFHWCSKRWNSVCCRSWNNTIWNSLLMFIIK